MMVGRDITDVGTVTRVDLVRADGAPGDATRRIFDAVREAIGTHYARHLRHKYHKQEQLVKYREQLWS